MADIGNNEIDPTQKGKPENVQLPSTKEPSLREKLAERVRGLFKKSTRVVASPKNESSDPSPEAPIHIPAESGYQKLMQSFESTQNYDSPNFPGVVYKGEQVQKMFENVFPDLVQRLSGDSSNTSSIEQLSQLHEGNIVTIYDVLGRVQTDLERKLPKENSTAAPEAMKIANINVIRGLLEEQVKALKSAEIQTKLQDSIKDPESTKFVQAQEGRTPLTALVDDQVGEILAKSSNLNSSLDQRKDEE